ncbi:hypothetical protein F383_18176 [Gossypium arboreum]|uniref:Uncharacterized protein n=1 Tax=Gossypium arboreum TaxID=29729 RepID=A0A0B0MLW7_GOSAR|nr:hypothetical protein F383_18176 [Gossypium arboreum]
MAIYKKNYQPKKANTFGQINYDT